MKRVVVIGLIVVGLIGLSVIVTGGCAARKGQSVPQATAPIQHNPATGGQATLPTGIPPQVAQSLAKNATGGKDPGSAQSDNVDIIPRSQASNGTRVTDIPYGGRAGGGGGAGGGGFGIGGGGGGVRIYGGNPRLFGGGGGGGGSPPAVRQQLAAPEISQRPAIVIPLQTEELWIIAKPQAAVFAAPADDRNPGSGALMARLPNRTEQVAVPLKHTDVQASIAGYIATVDVQQQYQNPYSEKIEAIYVFPLPQNAAVNEFLMTIGDRHIRGIIRDRAEAEQIYQQARSQGYVASLLTQERPNIFTQSVANIEPGKQIDIDIKYFHTLDYIDGWYEWHFPMVVGPRYNPSSSAGDGIGAVGVGARGTSGQSTEVQYLRPEQRSGHDISLDVKLDAGMKVEQIECPSHHIMTESRGEGITEVKLAASDSIPNKDFVLRYKVAGNTVKTAMMVQRDPKGGGGYFTLMLVPPESMTSVPRQPLEMVFTLDVSGSMTGRPFEQARQAVKYALTHMQPSDTFQVIRFADRTELMTPRAVPATPENIQRALAYINQMSAGGGTEMLDGIRDSLNFPRDPMRSRYVAFLTDGYIGNEADILREIHNSIRDSRIFSFGVDGSPNRYLLDHMAKMGAGAAAYPSPSDNPDDYMQPYFDRISHPVLTDISVDFGGMKVTDVFPEKIPDLFVGRPVIISGRFTGEASSVRVHGRFAGEEKDFTIPIKLDDQLAQHAGVKTVWARMKISDLAERAIWENGLLTDLDGSIRQVALENGLMSQFTAFVAVDSTAVTAADHGISVSVPVPVPDGVRYDTTVSDPRRQ